MIHIVTSENTPLFRRELQTMFEHRKRVFIEQLQWPDLKSSNGAEFDDYDHEEAIYLLHMDGSGRLAASTRLLPTQRPHLLIDHFGSLCDDAPPQGPLVWEVTRFCPHPDASPAERRRLLSVIIAGIMETGLLFGIRQVTFVASPGLRPLARGAGWSTTFLGAAQNRTSNSALCADIDVAGLERVRRKHRLPAPLVRFTPAFQAAA